MKKLFYIACLLLIAACSKPNTPAPATTNATSTTTLDCSNSNWEYEVILGTPCTIGEFSLRHADAYGNIIEDTTITTSWTKSFTWQQPGPYQMFMQVIPGPLSVRNAAINNLTNTVMVNIYKNGDLVKTTGMFIDFCVGTVTPCAPTTTPAISQTYLCT